jgi:hypothetical protein
VVVDLGTVATPVPVVDEGVATGAGNSDPGAVAVEAGIAAGGAGEDEVDSWAGDAGNDTIETARLIRTSGLASTPAGPKLGRSAPECPAARKPGRPPWLLRSRGRPERLPLN